MTAQEVMRRLGRDGYRLEIRQGRLGYVGPRGSEISATLLADMRLHVHELRILAAVEAYSRNPHRCRVCGFQLSIVAVGPHCGRCAALPRMVRQGDPELTTPVTP
jgi:hypothetical protein